MKVLTGYSPLENVCYRLSKSPAPKGRNRRYQWSDGHRDADGRGPRCDLIFTYHNEVKEHIMLDHAEHAGVVAGIELHELPHLNV